MPEPTSAAASETSRAPPRPRIARHPRLRRRSAGWPPRRPRASRLDHAVERHGVHGCRPEGLDQRLVVGHEHGSELDGAVEPSASTAHPSADAVARLEHDDLEARVHEVQRGGEPREARADHGHALARLGNASDLLGGILPGVACAGERAGSPGEQASPAIQSRSPTGSAREARSLGVPDGVVRERAAREGVEPQLDRRIAVGSGTPSGGIGVGVGVGVGLAVGVGDGLGSGGGHVQLASATPAIPESDAARKVRRAMPPDAARESMGFRLADRTDGGGGRRAGQRPGRTAVSARSPGRHAGGAERLREPGQARLDRLHRRGERDPEESGGLEHPPGEHEHALPIELRREQQYEPNQGTT